MNSSKIIIRDTQTKDVDQVIYLLQSLSKYTPSKKAMLTIHKDFFNQKNVYSCVATIDNKIVGYGSIIIEIKIRGGKKGHIEDIVTHKDFRKMHIGSKIIDYLTNIAKIKKCYKTSLECKRNNIQFYQNCSFEISGTGMEKYL